jgi:hypothetical protein
MREKRAYRKGRPCRLEKNGEGQIYPHSQSLCEVLLINLSSEDLHIQNSNQNPVRSDFEETSGLY